MANKINILTISYFILSFYVLIVQLKDLKYLEVSLLKESKELEEINESGESKNATTTHTAISLVQTTEPDENGRYTASKYLVHIPCL